MFCVQLFIALFIQLANIIFSNIYYPKNVRFLSIHTLYFIYKGYVRLYSISESGQELTLIIFKPKDVFPIRWAVVNGSPYYCEAITSVEVAKAPRDKFLEFSEKSPEVL